MIELKNKTIAEIVSADISTASIFKKYQIDFCCGGGKTVEYVCKKANINVDDVINDLINNVPKDNAPNLNFKDWTPEFLVDYIVNVHHTFVRANLDIINEFSKKVANVHGHHAEETIEINDLFTELKSELLSHLEKEENILFPAIKMKANNADYEYDTEVIRILEDEHEHAGDLVKKITYLSNNFSPPDWACNTFKALYFKLDEFINDLYQHIHLENNILFSKIK